MTTHLSQSSELRPAQQPPPAHSIKKTPKLDKILQRLFTTMVRHLVHVFFGTNAMDAFSLQRYNEIQIKISQAQVCPSQPATGKNEQNVMFFSRLANGCHKKENCFYRQKKSNQLSQLAKWANCHKYLISKLAQTLEKGLPRLTEARKASHRPGCLFNKITLAYLKHANQTVFATNSAPQLHFYQHTRHFQQNTTTKIHQQSGRLAGRPSPEQCVRPTYSLHLAGKSAAKQQPLGEAQLMRTN